MKKQTNTAIEVQGTPVKVQSRDGMEYICLTDIARFKNEERSDDLIRNWLRNRNTIEFLGVWEKLNNADFNSVEFDGIKTQAGLNSFSLTPKQWRAANSEKEGNMRDHASIEQLLVLANIESMNAESIHMKLNQQDRLTKLNQIAIRQMKTLMTSMPPQLKLPE